MSLPGFRTIILSTPGLLLLFFPSLFETTIQILTNVYSIFSKYITRLTYSHIVIHVARVHVVRGAEIPKKRDYQVLKPWRDF